MIIRISFDRGSVEVRGLANPTMFCDGQVSAPWPPAADPDGRRPAAEQVLDWRLAPGEHPSSDPRFPLERAVGWG